MSKVDDYGIEVDRDTWVKVTQEDVEDRIGSDNLVEDLLKVVTDVANGDYTVETLHGDIRSYSDYRME